MQRLLQYSVYIAYHYLSSAELVLFAGILPGQ